MLSDWYRHPLQQLVNGVQTLLELYGVTDAVLKLSRYAGRTVALLLALWIILGLGIVSSLVQYVVLYWLYMPDMHATVPAYFDFRVEPPLATIDLLNKQWAYSEYSIINASSPLNVERSHLLHDGLLYDVFLDLSVPDSPANREVGMMTVHMQLLADTSAHSGTVKEFEENQETVTQEVTVLATSTRPLLITYKSTFIRWIYQLIMAPWLILGVVEETHQLSLRLFDDYYNNPADVLSRVQVSLHANTIANLQLYDAAVRFQVNLTGVRYYMYYWFLTSTTATLVCLSIVNCCFLIGLGVLVYIQLVDGTEHDDNEQQQQQQQQQHPTRAVPNSISSAAAPAPAAVQLESKQQRLTTNSAIAAAEDGEREAADWKTKLPLATVVDQRESSLYGVPRLEPQTDVTEVPELEVVPSRNATTTATTTTAAATVGVVDEERDGKQQPSPVSSLRRRKTTEQERGLTQIGYM
jgi:hypothetical protein